jgi:hypothetical protein
MGITKIGRCILCQRSAKLHPELESCPRCTEKKTPAYLKTVKRVRQEPEFAKLCYETLQSDHARKAFADQFGITWDSKVPGELASDDHMDVAPDSIDPHQCVSPRRFVLYSRDIPLDSRND